MFVKQTSVHARHELEELGAGSGSQTLQLVRSATACAKQVLEKAREMWAMEHSGLASVEQHRSHVYIDDGKRGENNLKM
eukprot:scaffold424384_cov19-Prasinocladus_malaysianus.AAC.1